MNYLLNNNWNLWYHSLKDNNWDKKSYSKLITIRNLFDYKLIEDEFKQNHYQNGMFFLMKEDIFPNWEDPNNRLGGCLSFKIPSSELISSWNTLFQSCICEMILKGNNEEINGIFVFPTRELLGNIIPELILSKNLGMYTGSLRISNLTDVQYELIQKFPMPGCAWQLTLTKTITKEKK